MRQSSPQTSRQQSTTKLAPSLQAPRSERELARPSPPATVEVLSADHACAPRLPRAERVRGLEAAPDKPLLQDQVEAGARSLARRMRALQDRYEEEHRRLADSLEFLSVQSRDLERELASFGQLAELLENEAVATPLIPHISAAAILDGHQANGGAVLTDEWMLFPSKVRAARPIHNGREGALILEVRCLGAFEVRYQGRPVDLGNSRNGRLVFKYLLARAPARRASKELLAELFWPESPVERSLPSLQTAVHQLKRAMARGESDLATSPVIVYAGDHYGLSSQVELQCDVDVFRRRVREARTLDARGDIEAACRAYWLAYEAYGGEFLPEERYEDWITAERASLESDQLWVLTRLVQLHVERGEYLEGVHFGRVLLELDSTREDVHRDVMRCYSRLGQRSEALRQYRRCFEALQAELDLVPEQDTTALFERLASGQAV